jgi:uncharacterized protein YybS (DUF2232 family)
MNQNPQAGHNVQVRLKASLLGVVGSFVLFAAYLAIPPLGIFSGLIAPFPAAYNRVLHGRMAALIVLIGTATAITALFGMFAGCLYLGMCGMTGFLMPELLLRGKNGSQALFWTTVANVLILVLGIVIYSSVSATSLQQLLSAEITDSVKQAVVMYEKAGVTGEDLDTLKRSMATGAELLKRLYPALVTSLLIIVAGCNLVLLKRTTAKAGITLNSGEFSTFRNPDLLVWVLIAAGFAMLLPDSVVTSPALNIMLVVALLYLFQGLAVISAIVQRYSLSAMVRIVLYAMLILQPYLLALVAGIGLFDIWVDFRTPKKQENL